MSPVLVLILHIARFGVGYFIDFERIDKSFYSKNNFEQNSVYTSDCYATKTKDIETLILLTLCDVSMTKLIYFVMYKTKFE